LLEIWINREKAVTMSDVVHSPEAEVMRRQAIELLEDAIAKLPESLRVVFMLREVEGLSIQETAEALQIPRDRKNAPLAGPAQTSARARCEAPRRLARDVYFRRKRLRCAHGARACSVHSVWAQSLSWQLSAAGWELILDDFGEAATGQSIVGKTAAAPGCCLVETAASSRTLAPLN
jgi:hypothetical protein